MTNNNIAAVATVDTGKTSNIATASSSPPSSSSSPTSSISTILNQIPLSVHLDYLRQTIQLASQSPPKPTNFRVGCVIVAFSRTGILRRHDSQREQQQQQQISGSLLSSSSSSVPRGTVLATGYTLELAGNTHAEQCALAKLLVTRRGNNNSSDESGAGTTSTTTASASASPSLAEPDVNPPLSHYGGLFVDNDDDNLIILYTSLEPCSVRLSGAIPCVQRIIATTTTSPSIEQSERQKGKGIHQVIFGAKEPGTFVQDSQSCQILDAAGVPWSYVADFEREILDVAMAGHDTTAQQAKTSTSESNVGDGGSGYDGARAAFGTPGTRPAKKEEEGKGKEETRLPSQKEEPSQPRNPKKRMMEYVPGT